jgi:hypothetical protein
MHRIAIEERNTRSPRGIAIAARIALTAFAFSCLFMGCKGSSDVGSVAVGVTPDFIPESPTVSGLFVSLEESAVSGGRITIDVVVTEVPVPVSGIALKLRYPGDIAKFEQCLDGDLFDPGSCTVSQTPLDTDRVFIYRGITNPEPPVPVSGSRVVVRMVFIVFGTGIGSANLSPNLVFEAQNIGGGDASAVLDANGDAITVDWFAGTIMGI